MVTSKYDRSHGRPRTPGKVQGPGGTASTGGVQPAMRGPVAPQGNRPNDGVQNTHQRAVGHHHEIVGFLPNTGGKYQHATHPMTGKHGSDSVVNGTSTADHGAFERSSYTAPRKGR